MGGAQYQAKCIIEELIKTQRYEIFYLARHYDPDYASNGYTLVRYHYPGSEIRGSHRHIIEWSLLPKLLEKIEPDVIYQRVGCSQTGIAAHYALKHRCKMVWHIASESDLGPYRFSPSRLFIYRMVDRFLLNYGIKNATNVIAQTNEQQRLLKVHFKRTASAVIPNLHPYPTEKIKKTKPVKIVWVANLKNVKQPEIFIRLANSFQDLPHTQFIMIGAIQGNERKQKGYLDMMNKTPSLKYLGQISQETVNAILAESHILVNTSIPTHEGMSNTFIQAWLRRTPVVSLNANPDYLLEKKRIGLFSGGSFEQLKKDVRKLVLDDGLREKIGINAQTFANDYYSTKNIEKIISVIEK
jgi:glycosyltransferase involved in cell wall biosynthesis